jgi:hypothetical protein
MNKSSKMIESEIRGAPSLKTATSLPREALSRELKLCNSILLFQEESIQES